VCAKSRGQDILQYVLERVLVLLLYPVIYDVVEWMIK
jgi:hypothetical protein